MNKNERFMQARVFECLKALDAACLEISAEERKNMTGADAKAFNAVRQKNKKALARYATEIQALSPADAAGENAAAAAAQPLVEEPVIKVIEMTPENVLRKLQEVIGSRGRKHSDKQESLAILRRLFELSANDRHRIQVLVGTIASEFDMIVSSLGYLPWEIYVETIKDTEKLLNLMATHNEQEMAINSEAEELGLPGIVSLQGSLLSFVQRLDDEFTKALQIIDPHTSEYEEFLRAELSLYAVLQQSVAYFAAIDHMEFKCQILIRQLDHLYFRPESVIVHLGATSATVGRLCQALYKHAHEKIKTRALLCHVYHLALHGHFTRARDVFVASHVSEHLAHLEVSSQILYNRTVVQLGLAAFQRGLLKEAYFALQEICSSGRPRDLLAQGMQSQKYVERTPEQERSERQRQLPSHMHINIELIDSVFLTTSMLLEIPQAAASARRFFRGDKKLFPSRHLRRLIDGFDRNLFNGPPENTRDHIISAAKALANGQWQRCLELALQLKLWSMFSNPTEIKAMLHRKIKEAGFCSFVLAFGPNYTSLSVDFLAKAFDLSPSLIEKITKRLVQEHGLPARIESGHLQWTLDVEVSPLQELVMQIKDKLSVLSERNQECSEVMSRTEVAAA